VRYYIENSKRSVSGFAQILQLVHAGDPHAVAAIETMCRALGCGMHMIVAALAPAEVVVVGELVRVWDMAFPVIDAELHRFPLIALPRLRITPEPDLARLRSAVALVMTDKTL
jgi:predicted NBD/HSP70 family sugar kinase